MNNDLNFYGSIKLISESKSNTDKENAVKTRYKLGVKIKNTHEHVLQFGETVILDATLKSQLDDWQSRQLSVEEQSEPDQRNRSSDAGYLVKPSLGRQKMFQNLLIFFRGKNWLKE